MDKSVKDYYDILYEKYPDIPKEDIRRAVDFGWKQLLRVLAANAEVKISDQTFWCYFGNLHKDSLKHFENYTKKLAIKIELLYKKKNIQWDGYYYFALNDTQYEQYVEQTKKRKGRPKKYISYGFVKLYKIKEECEVSERMKKYIFKIPMKADVGFKFNNPDLVSDVASLEITRNPLTFEDLIEINKKIWV